MAEYDLTKALNKRREISITVKGRRTNRAITIPVWFVADDHVVWLLPVYGSKTQCYQNLERDQAITIHAGTNKGDFRARLLKDAQAVRTVVEQFREKYSPGEIKRWYTGLDVAVQIPIASEASRS